MHDSFQFLEKYDVGGPSHYANALHKTVTAAYVDPKFAEHLKKPNCCNYNLDGINFNFTSSAFGINQCSNVNKNNAVNFEQNFCNDSTVMEELEPNSVWDQISPHFKDMISALEDEEDPSSIINDVISFLDEVSLKCRERQVSKIPRYDGCKYVSINPPTEKRLKTHGTKEL